VLNCLNNARTVEFRGSTVIDGGDISPQKLHSDTVHKIASIKRHTQVTATAVNLGTALNFRLKICMLPTHTYYNILLHFHANTNQIKSHLLRTVHRITKQKQEFRKSRHKENKKQQADGVTRTESRKSALTCHPAKKMKMVTCQFSLNWPI